MAKIVLFDGTTLENFTKRDGTPNSWILNDDGTMTVARGGGDIVSKVKYKDAHIHVEWREPDMPDKTGQAKGNSGVYIHGCYELQVLDSYGVDSGKHDCGSIYNNYAPIKNACKPALEWQTYDIIFRSPRYNARGEMMEAARVSVLQNGEVIQNNIILHKHTPGGVTEHAVTEGPLLLQDHGDPVTFRNIWIDTLDE